MSMEGTMQSVREMARTTALSLLARPEVRKQVLRARKQFGVLDTRTRSAVKERPISAVGAALLAGYAIGRMRARRKENGSWNSRAWWTS